MTSQPPDLVRTNYDDRKGIGTMQTLIADLFCLNPVDRDEKLSSALASAIHAATAEKDCGVLITRHRYSRFTVALSTTVPYGQTRERDLM